MTQYDESDSGMTAKPNYPNLGHRFDALMRTRAESLPRQSDYEPRHLTETKPASQTPDTFTLSP